MNNDSVDKIVSVYFAAMTRHPFEYRGRVYKPKPLHVSPCLFRGYACPSGCGACCQKFSLVYLPSEDRTGLTLRPRVVRFNGRAVMTLVDTQDEHNNHHCKHVQRADGRCGIHGRQPFSCDFELMRVKTFDDHNALGTLLYGRGWQLLRIVDNERGAMCSIEPYSLQVKQDLIRRLKRLATWCDWFGLKRHRVPDVIKLVVDDRTQGAVLA